ncbi:hypothetical protein B0T09DRAFT_382363 [Sordaria sp. MPI-SDFR-AT-0083]|nr:hypothetical protein B0T09DRAFT_382363 [Sordaria sp. MPI-SDFR-AT-0083]
MESPSPSAPSVPDEREVQRAALVGHRQRLTDALALAPYDLILYLERAVVYSDLAYPDLAAGDAYRALLLTDEVLNEGFEYHEQAKESLEAHSTEPCPKVLNHGDLLVNMKNMADGDEVEGSEPYRQLAITASVRCFQILSLSLLLCGCLASASDFVEKGLKILPENKELLEIKGYTEQVARRRLRLKPDDPIDFHDLPDVGVVRREIYPWNTYEPDRFSEESLSFLNGQLETMAPKCALGLFAQEDIAPGEAVLKEYSLLTANNRHKESTCDACGTELPPLKVQTEAVSCPECYDTVFCDEFCFEKAQEEYHPAVCDKDVDSIAKDPEAKDVAESLYLLLLARLLAMSNHQEVHPLELKEIKYIWGDFYNIEIPLHILEKMDIDIFETLPQHDLWVFNTAYSKFRGTASARKGLRDGRPEVAAVHPFWCLANHDCDPNVTWEWGGRMTLFARETRVVGNRPGGIKAGEEILNHYCDVDLPVKDRREWAQGALGGWCMCKRCRDEAAATNGSD